MITRDGYPSPPTTKPRNARFSEATVTACSLGQPDHGEYGFPLYRGQMLIRVGPCEALIAILSRLESNPTASA